MLPTVSERVSQYIQFHFVCTWKTTGIWIIQRHRGHCGHCKTCWFKTYKPHRNEILYQHLTILSSHPLVTILFSCLIQSITLTHTHKNIYINETINAKTKQQVTCAPLFKGHGVSPYENISHSVTPNIHTSLACENCFRFRLSGAHLYVREAREGLEHETRTTLWHFIAFL